MTEYSGDGTELDAKLPHHDNTKNPGIDRIYGINPNANIQHHGYKLFIQGPLGWTGPPTGDGVDDYLRSVNMWDGHQWLQLCYGGGVSPTKLRQVNVKIPPLSVDYTSPTTNPMMTGQWTTWVNGGSSGDIGEQQAFRVNWLPLFFLKPRVDPAWRIVSLCGGYPLRPQVNHNDSANPYPFYPRGGFLTSKYTKRLDTGAVTTQTSAVSMTRNDPDPQILCRVDTTTFDQSAQDYLTAHNAGYVTNTNIVSAGMIDFLIIRRKLKEYFATCDPYFNGSYDDMVLQHLIRVYIVADITFKLTIDGSPPAGIYSNVRARVYMNTDVPYQFTSDPYMPIDYGDNTYTDVRCPASFTPNGSILFDRTGVIENDGVLHGQLFDFQPGENNMAFYAVIDNIPAPYVDYDRVQFTFEFKATQINLHYATAGSDTPVETHDHYVTTYDVA